MNSLIVCVSVSHGNTLKVADRMAEVLDAEVVEPEAVDVDRIGGYDLVGFGSGIYFMTVHLRLWTFLGRLPRVDAIPAFTFFTSGASEIPLVGYSQPIRRRLASKGFRVLGSFSCRGLDTVGPLRLVGGVNKGRPSDRDLDAAAAFAARVGEQVSGSKTAT
ncbi:MAG TPA: flavodoxin family protein [Mycobacterium sp.]|nr:flavodoxin family protein [Mycobacterium sp.]